jgi:hypothetical protein
VGPPDRRGTPIIRKVDRVNQFKWHTTGGTGGGGTERTLMTWKRFIYNKAESLVL